MVIKESAENYLETILILKDKNGYVRSIDVANELAVTKPSVSVAMKKFREDGYITIDADGRISLTKKGKEIALRVYERHQVITKVLISMGVDEDIACEDSCKIEHDISEHTFEKLKEYLNNIDKM